MYHTGSYLQFPQQPRYPRAGRGSGEVRCDVCDISVKGQEQYSTHLAGSKHAKKLKETENAKKVEGIPFLKYDECSMGYTCTICNVTMNSSSVAMFHVAGSRHEEAVKSVKTEEQSLPTEDGGAKESSNGDGTSDDKLGTKESSNGDGTSDDKLGTKESSNGDGTSDDKLGTKESSNGDGTSDDKLGTKESSNSDGTSNEKLENDKPSRPVPLLSLGLPRAFGGNAARSAPKAKRNNFNPNFRPNFNSPKPSFNYPRPYFNSPRPNFNSQRSDFNWQRPNFNSQRSDFNWQRPNFEPMSKYRYQVKPLASSFVSKYTRHDVVSTVYPGMNAAPRHRNPNAGPMAMTGAQSFPCLACNIYTNSEQQLQTHLSSEKHKNRLVASGSEPNGRQPVPPPIHVTLSCESCNVAVNSQIQLDQHLQSPKHRNRLAQRYQPY